MGWEMGSGSVKGSVGWEEGWKEGRGSRGVGGIIMNGGV